MCAYHLQANMCLSVFIHIVNTTLVESLRIKWFKLIQLDKDAYFRVSRLID